MDWSRCLPCCSRRPVRALPPARVLPIYYSWFPPFFLECEFSKTTPLRCSSCLGLRWASRLAILRILSSLTANQEGRNAGLLQAIHRWALFLFWSERWSPLFAQPPVAP